MKTFTWLRIMFETFLCKYMVKYFSSYSIVRNHWPKMKCECLFNISNQWGIKGFRKYFSAICTMDSKLDWGPLLVKKYVSFNVEVEAFLDSLDVSNSTDISMAFIYDRIRNDRNVSPDLIKLYKEAVYGTEKVVKLRIKNRLTNFKRNLKWVYRIKSL